MSISDLGSIGELVGAIGVIASLLYLAAQVRGARKLARAQNVREVFDGVRRTMAVVYADPELAAIWIRGHERPDELSEVDRLRFRQLIADYILTYREAQVAWREGMLSAADHARVLQLVASVLNTEGGARVWSHLKHGFSEDLAVALSEARAGSPVYQPAPEFPRLSSGESGGAV